MKTVIFCLFILNESINFGKCQFPENPCPDIFNYNYDGRQWHGRITVPTPTKNTAILKVTFSTQDTSIRNYGIDLDDKSNALNRIKNGQPFTYDVRLPVVKYIPKVISIEYEDRIVCRGPAANPERYRFYLTYTYKWNSGNVQQNLPVPQNFPVHLNLKPQRYPLIPSPSRTNQPLTVTTKPHFTDANQCGVIIRRRTRGINDDQIVFEDSSEVFNIVNDEQQMIMMTDNSTENNGTVFLEQQTIENENKENIDDDNEPDVVPHIYNGKVISKNEHPWLVAMFEDGHGALTFFCGAVLISNRHVLTAAHCTESRRNKVKIQLKIGAHTKDYFELGAVFRTAKSILQHPEYVSNSAHADISMITFSSPVEFTTSIRPVCLWHDDFNRWALLGQIGTIMGWGQDERGDATAIPMQTNVVVASEQDCKRVQLLKDIISDRTFCAGMKGTGPCLGDSGGGFYIIKDNRWYLRGIISTAISNRQKQCDTDTYSVYVDTFKYLNWIQQNML